MAISERVRDYTKRPITTAIFDVGGVLINQSPQSQHEAIIAAACLDTPEKEAEYYHLVRERKLWSQYHRGRITDHDAALQFRQLTKGVDLLLPEQPDDSPLVTVALAMEPKVEVFAIVKKLPEVGVTPVVLSNSIPLGEKVFEAHGIRDHFRPEHVVFSHEIGLSKPDRKIYEYTLRQAGVEDPADAVFWDDIERNIVAANEVGIHGRLFKAAETVLTDLQELGIRLY